MAYTKTQLSTAVCRKLGLVDALATPAATDTSYINGEYDQKLEEWRSRGLVYWENTDATTSEIPVEVFPPLIDLMANEVGATFGLPSTPEDKLAREELLLKGLRRHVTRRASGLPVKADYY